MSNEEYEAIVKKHKPTEQRILNIVKAFVIGGIIGIIGHFLLEFYTTSLAITSKEASTLVIISLILVASFFTALGFFDNWINFGRAGFFIPITGFAHAMTSTCMEYRKEGLVTGIGSNIFKLTGTVILYGIVSAYLFGLIRFLLFGG